MSFDGKDWLRSLSYCTRMETAFLRCAVIGVVGGTNTESEKGFRSLVERVSNSIICGRSVQRSRKGKPEYYMCPEEVHVLVRVISGYMAELRVV